MGGFGCGKIMILWLIGGQVSVVVGIVCVYGQDIGVMDKCVLYVVCCQMGMLFQFGVLFMDLFVFDNVVFLLCEYIELFEVFICDLVLMKFNVVGLCGVCDLMFLEIFGGMVWCVVLVWVIVFDLLFIFYDELFVGLDLILLGLIVLFICKLNDVLGVISIIVLYDVQEMFYIVDYVYFIVNGGIVVQGMLVEFVVLIDLFVCQFVYGEVDGFVLFYYFGVLLVDDFGLGKSGGV